MFRRAARLGLIGPESGVEPGQLGLELIAAPRQLGDLGVPGPRPDRDRARPEPARQVRDGRLILGGASHGLRVQIRLEAPPVALAPLPLEDGTLGGEDWR